ncbi:hypothetical protein ACH4MU_20810 [Streptomyces albidoflavus]
MTGGGYTREGAYTFPRNSFPQNNGWTVSAEIPNGGQITVYAVCLPLTGAEPSGGA